MPHPSATPRIFDTAAIRQARNRAAGTFSDYDFLISWSHKQLCDRLKDIKRSFPHVLILGGRDAQTPAGILKAEHGAEDIYVCDIAGSMLSRLPDTPCIPVQAAEDFLPFQTDFFDMVLSGSGLHSVNDLPGALIQINRVLKPDGVFLGAFPGGETLKELRHSLGEAELSLSGGLSPRIFPMADKADAGALLQRAGFALPVVDSDILTVTYKNTYALMKDLRGMGESNALMKRHKTIPSRNLFAKADAFYSQAYSEDDGRIVASFEIIFMIGWAPHKTQQKPLPRGSAKTRLADALGTDETAL